MDIIIAGAGKVGFRLAQTLSLSHSVYIIDKNKEALSRLSETIDVLPIVGDIEDPDTYNSLHNRRFDIFIAVTDSDEANIISTLITDDAIDAKTKIIRLRNDFFAKSSISNKLGISHAVFPFIDTAKSIEALLDFPKANNVKSIPFTDYKLISVKAQRPVIREYNELNSKDCRFIGYEREKRFFFSADRIEEGDLIYLFGEKERIKEICKKIDTLTSGKINNIAIFGAKLLGLEIAKRLVAKRLNIKIIEEDPQLCKKASEVLQERATVINSRYIEHTLFEEENIKNADMVIASSSDDEENIVKSLEAKEYGVKKCVAINNSLEYYDLMHKLSITAIRGPKSNAFYAILEKIASSAVIGEKHFCGGRGVVFVRKIFPNSILIGKKISRPKIEGKLFIVKDGIKELSEQETLKEGDVIVFFTYSKYEEEVKNWIYNL